MPLALLVTDAGRSLIRDSISGVNASLIRYVAVGSSTVGPATSDTQLGSEKFRKTVTSYANGVNPGEVTISLFLAPGDAVGVNIQEVGFFGGTTASAIPNSGVLLARGSFAHNPKQNTESILFTFDFTL